MIFIFKRPDHGTYFIGDYANDVGAGRWSDTIEEAISWFGSSNLHSWEIRNTREDASFVKEQYKYYDTICYFPMSYKEFKKLNIKNEKDVKQFVKEHPEFYI